jgi:hypothetical protein
MAYKINSFHIEAQKRQRRAINYLFSRSHNITGQWCLFWRRHLHTCASTHSFTMFFFPSQLLIHFPPPPNPKFVSRRICVRCTTDNSPAPQGSSKSSSDNRRHCRTAKTSNAPRVHWLTSSISPFPLLRQTIPTSLSSISTQVLPRPTTPYKWHEEVCK